MEGFLEQLASGSAAPGGGAATAVMAGMAASLLGMCCRLSLGREHHAQNEPELAAVLALADEARFAAAGLCAADTAAWTAVMDARLARRRAADAADPAAPADAADVSVESAMKAATEVPLAVLALVARLARGFDVAERRVNTHVRADLAVGAMAGRAALEGAAGNVAENLAGIKDQSFVLAVQAKTAQLVSEGLGVFGHVAGRHWSGWGRVVSSAAAEFP